MSQQLHNVSTLERERLLCANEWRDLPRETIIRTVVLIHDRTERPFIDFGKIPHKQLPLYGKLSLKKPIYISLSLA